MTTKFDLKITSAIVIDGKIRKAGSIVSVSERDAKDFLQRGKAVLATTEDVRSEEVKDNEVNDENVKDDEVNDGGEKKPSAGLNVEKLKEALTAKGIEFQPNAKKAELAALLDEAPAE